MWTEKSVTGSTRTFHRNLFKRWVIWFDSLDGKVVADVCSGNGRNVWGLNHFTKAKKIISIELAESSIDYQKNKFKDDQNIEVIQADATEVKFRADFIYLYEAIQHTANPEQVLKNIYGNLCDDGELVVTFYCRTFATMAIEPIRFITKRLPRQLLWWISPPLLPYLWLGLRVVSWVFKMPGILHTIGLHATSINGILLSLKSLGFLRIWESKKRIFLK
jgi:ubiquinone/menaquinone biosynthesis C-methylase UbiE